MVIAGKAITIRIETISAFQVKSGIRIRVMPGARIFRMVMMKLREAATEAIPRTWRPSAQKSTLRPKLNPLSVRGA